MWTNIVQPGKMLIVCQQSARIRMRPPLCVPRRFLRTDPVTPNKGGVRTQGSVAIR